MLTRVVVCLAQQWATKTIAIVAQKAGTIFPDAFTPLSCCGSSKKIVSAITTISTNYTTVEVLKELKTTNKPSMKTNKWIFAIMIASVAWVSCDDDDDTPLNKPDLNETDETFVEVAARSNMAEIEFGELAATKATDTSVIAFAEEMVAAHTTAQTELKDLADDYGNVEWPNDLDEGHDSIMSQLNEASGYTFDTLYLRTQINMHEDAKMHFESATTASTDARVKAYANKYLPKIEMHLEHADSIQAAVVTDNTTTVDDTTDDGTGTDDGTTGDGTN